MSKQGSLRTRALTQASSMLAISIVSLIVGVSAEVVRADDSQMCAAPERPAASRAQPPEELFGKLFSEVQLAEIFEDQKTFADAVPKQAPKSIVREYQATKDDPTFDLEAFVLEHFSLPSGEGVTPPEDLSLTDHIDWLWPELTRSITTVAPGDSLLPLPEPYIVPGGRYQELYYWDSYFTMVGLAETGREDLVRTMLDDFAYEIDQYGHIPNGSRTYQLSRSQPPFFSSMVELATAFDGSDVIARYLPQLRREHAFWLAGARRTKPGTAYRRVVKLPDGTVLNRYWDDRDTPRSESFAYDVATAEEATDRPPAEVYRDLRATAESGWDFSSRWLEDGSTLSTIRTTSIIPVDLNSLLYHLEVTIARSCEAMRDRACTDEFSELARERAGAIQRYLWNDAGYYTDYDWVLGQQRDDVTAAMAFPLFARVATAERAQRTAATMEQLLAPGGLLTTTRESGQQWDAPNGWAPLTWIAVDGLLEYEQDALAREIGTRFLARVAALYEAEGKLVEKYDVQSESVVGGGGGEYPLQDGFAWTNAVTLKLISLYGAP
jgi:alpha,alpha-trehalase